MKNQIKQLKQKEKGGACDGVLLVMQVKAEVKKNLNLNLNLSLSGGVSRISRSPWCIPAPDPTNS